MTSRVSPMGQHVAAAACRARASVASGEDPFVLLAESQLAGGAQHAVR